MGGNGETRYIADCMLGRLAKWLRALGLDVAYDRRIDDDALIARAWREGRVILTRDRALAGRRAVKDNGVTCLLIASPDPDQQLAEMVRLHGLRPDTGRLLTRCLRCNEPTRDVTRESVASEVPPYVLATQTRFSRCPACERVYWKATHVEGLLDRLARAGGG